MEKVSIIVVNWNTKDLLRKCLLSLNALPEKGIISEVIVVDNASHDNSLSLAQEASYEIPVSFIPLQNNIGFAAGNNKGYEKLKNKHSHMFLLNPDTEVKPGALQTMVDTLESDVTTGIVGPKLLEADGSLQPSVRSFPTFTVLLLFLLKLNRLAKNTGVWRRYMMVDFDYNTRQPVDQIMGAAMLIKNKLHQTIGLLDDSYWIWFEEVDYCKKAITKGYTVVYEPNASITHYGGVSFGQVNGLKKAYVFAKSIINYSSKHLGILATLLLLIASPFGMLIALIRSLIHTAVSPK